MRLTKFLFIIEKITIIVIVLTFIPIALFVYKAKNVQVSDSLEAAYSNIIRQSRLQGFLTSPKNISICQSPPVLFYQLCYNRCKIGQDCVITNLSSMCFLSQSYKLGSFQFCSQQPIKNQISQQFSTSTLNNAVTPLAFIKSTQKNYTLQYYCLSNVEACHNVYDVFGQSIGSKFSGNYGQFHNAATYIMYFGLIPLVAHIVLVVILDLIKKFNLRMTNSLLVIHQALVGIGCIILVLQFDQNNQDLIKSLKTVTTSCLIKDGSYCQKTLFQYFAQFNGSDGIPSAFVTSMMFVLILQILCLVVILIVNILIMKYYQLKDDSRQFDGYELQTL